MSAWPSSVCTTRRSAPFCSRWLAKAWRSTCGLTLPAGRPAATASAFRSRAKCWRVRWPLSPNDGNSHLGVASLCSRLASAIRREIVAHRLLGGVVERHQALLAALAAHHQQPLVAPRRRGGQRDQLGHAQAGGVEHLEQADEARGAQPLGGSSRRLDGRARGREQAVDLRDRQHLRQRRGRASGLRSRRPDRRRDGPRHRGNGRAGGPPTAAAPPRTA